MANEGFIKTRVERGYGFNSFLKNAIVIFQKQASCDNNTHSIILAQMSRWYGIEKKKKEKNVWLQLERWEMCYPGDPWRCCKNDTNIKSAYGVIERMAEGLASSIIELGMLVSDSNTEDGLLELSLLWSLVPTIPQSSKHAESKTCFVLFCLWVGAGYKMSWIPL